MEEAPTTPTLAPPAQTPAFYSVVSTSPPAAATTTISSPAPLLPPPAASPQAASTQAAPPPPAPLPDRESRRGGSVGGCMGLTKEVLSAHTQQEEQAFLHRFKDLSKLRVFDQTASSALRCHAPTANPLARGRRQPAAWEFSTCTDTCTQTHRHVRTFMYTLTHAHINMFRHTRIHALCTQTLACVDRLAQKYFSKNFVHLWAYTHTNSHANTHT